MRANGFMIKIRNRQGVVWSTWAEFYARPGMVVVEPDRLIDIDEVIDQRANEMPDIHLPIIPMDDIPAVPIENDPADMLPNVPFMNGPVQILPQQPIIVDNADHFQEGDPDIEFIHADDMFYEDFSE